MKANEILEGNKLIAEFMGAIIRSSHIHPYEYAEFRDNKGIEIENIRTDNLKYHYSWDWLMPVVEKIESIKNSDDYEVDIFGNCCDIGGKFEAIGKNKIEATYKAIILFIKWYNSNP